MEDDSAERPDSPKRGVMNILKVTDKTVTCMFGGDKCRIGRKIRRSPASSSLLLLSQR